MEARVALMLANGVKKAETVALAIEGPVTAQVTASMLQLHPQAIVVLDSDAASRLSKTEYYKWVYENKPAVPA